MPVGRAVSHMNDLILSARTVQSARKTHYLLIILSQHRTDNNTQMGAGKSVIIPRLQAARRALPGGLRPFLKVVKETADKEIER